MNHMGYEHTVIPRSKIKGCLGGGGLRLLHRRHLAYTVPLVSSAHSTIFFSFLCQQLRAESRVAVILSQLHITATDCSISSSSSCRSVLVKSLLFALLAETKS
jgi:hypothetical protein